MRDEGAAEQSDPITLMKLRMLADAAIHALSGTEADEIQSAGPYKTVFLSADEAEVRRALRNLLVVLKQTKHEQLVAAIESFLSCNTN